MTFLTDPFHKTSLPRLEIAKIRKRPNLRSETKDAFLTLKASLSALPRSPVWFDFDRNSETPLHPSRAPSPRAGCPCFDVRPLLCVLLIAVLLRHERRPSRTKSPRER